MVRFGVIGCGNISGTYLYSLCANRNAKVVAVVDVNQGKAEEIAEIYRIDRIYGDFRQLLKKELLDAVVICTPHYLHYEQVVACAEKGVNILCEKPLATNMSDVEDMIKKCAHIKFSVMLQHRFYPSSVATRNAVQSGMIGKIKEVSLCFSCYKSDKFYDSWRGKKISGGGVMLSQALHRIDRLIYFFGDPEFVEGFMRTTRPGIEVEDYAECRLYFGDDVIAEIKADNSSGNPDTISMIKIVGDKGLIVLCDDRVLQWDVGCMPCPQASDFSRIPVKIRPLYYGPCHELIIDDFVDAVLNDRLPIVGPHDAEITMRTIFGFYQAAREQKRVFLK